MVVPLFLPRRNWSFESGKTNGVKHKRYGAVYGPVLHDDYHFLFSIHVLLHLPNILRPFLSVEPSSLVCYPPKHIISISLS
ncbi:MAG: hypothetical protein HY033_02360 [Ignavibacteriae bacterium]|nr:hypothetical protein [Ignavibacteria bacterium]MBI3363731.1 hypothetical protein [Ignavibacteriota bacterium]